MSSKIGENVDLINELITASKEAAVIGGEILKEHFRKVQSKDIEAKGVKDFVTYVDKLSEERIKNYLLSIFPDHAFLGEEEGKSGNLDSEYVWVVDPLDGTKNYINGFDIFAVSVALMKNDRPIAGSIYIPMLDKLYWAGEGQGSFLNGERINVSNRNSDYAVVATGFPFRYPEEVERYLKAFEQMMLTFSAVRRPGAAAVDLALTAEGVFDGFLEMKLSLWDVAAGILLIKEAGGKVTNFEGTDTIDGNVVAGNPEIYNQLFDIVKKSLV